MNKNLKDVLGGLEQSPPEKSARIVRDGLLEETLAALFEIYEKKLAMNSGSGNRFNVAPKFYNSCLKSMPKSKYDITKNVIAEFALRAAKYDDNSHFGAYTGYFITALMQTSFQQGHNNFELQLVSSEPIHHLGANLRGWQDRRLALKIVSCVEYKKRDLMNQPLFWFTNIAYIDATILGMNIAPQGIGVNTVSSSFTSDNKYILDAVGYHGNHTRHFVPRTEVKVPDAIANHTPQMQALAVA
ncbi:MAG: hypothetical protein HY438_01950 [DPANN group archaeon]|nr:hypothetical protein [DPANN group archaeon]